MKKHNYFSELYFLFLPLFFSGSLFGQQKIEPTNANQTKIEAVENNLLPTVKVSGEAPWNIHERMAHYDVQGVSIAVIDNYEIKWAKGYGVSDAKKKKPVTKNTLFQAASISKSINAVAVIKLLEQNKIKLDDDINNILQSWKLSGEHKVTTAHLLSHTGGLSTSGFNGYTSAKKLPSLTDILDGKKRANSEAVRSMNEPGLQFQYSGGGTLISQLMIEDLTNKSYENYINEQILRPLGMSKSYYSLNKKLKSNDLASGHWWGGKRLKSKYHIYPEQAAAGLWSTPTDLAKYVIAIQKSLAGEADAILAKTTAQKILTPVLEKHSTALGHFIRDKKGVLYFNNSGSNEGFTCHFFGSMEDGKGVVVMTNSERYEIIPEIINSVASVYKWENFYNQNPRTIVEVQAKDLTPLVGTYQFESGNELTIGQDKDILFLINSDNNQLDLSPQSNRFFFLRQVDEQIEFIETDGDISLNFHRNGKVYPAVKK